VSFQIVFAVFAAQQRVIASAVDVAVLALAAVPA
jgi:hypothetical protein